MNTFGKQLRVTTFGESHGVGIGCVVDGLPSGLKIDMQRIHQELERRKGGRNLYSTQRKEGDHVEILSGVFEGVSTGTPLAMLIYNQDQKSSHYENLKNVFRPGHADFTYFHKYGIRDHRGGGRSSARESAARVCAGSIAKMLLEHFGIFTQSGIYAIGEIGAENIHFHHAQKSPIYALDPAKEEAQKKCIMDAKNAHDSIGGVALIRAYGSIPIGLGEGLYHKLDAAIGGLLMGLNGVKAIEIGAGVQSARMRGSQNNDAMDAKGFLSNHHGGILGGMSSGEEILIKVHFKPTPSIFLTQQSKDVLGNPTNLNIKGRHDPCIAVRGSVVCEHLLSLVLADMLLLNTHSTMQNLEKIYF
ncbi:chorismate synthase [Helicobacter mustelae]|uniref:Chorismate synthase n=1 Tax=Helicobacter mustelae (strain ATCC 43772 / CCUG 25715 / CIP 103759 / LMG 18044 / NCTC 12198 / R85-136P) TaxID=679897 RepID=D3UJ53_HELM1|nr:chorismate synthase [Helicobacter mustelae]CBG40528.1 chorismate synthase [Helicobacter mustelae 12198]